MNYNQDFPFLKRGVHYLDNASMMQMPLQVAEKMKHFSMDGRANVGRSFYKLGVRATEEYELARKVIADFIGALPEEIIFTKGTTESLNLAVYGLSDFVKGKEILLTEIEHHSNLIPWQQLALSENAQLRFVSFNEKFEIDSKEVEKKLGKKTAVFAFCHASNVLGTVNDAKKFVRLAKKFGTFTVIDAAQSVGTEKINVKEIGCDFLAFSSHKIGGPTGIGVLYGRKELLEKMSPRDFGGGMVDDVDFERASFDPLPDKFQAGTPNVEGIIGLARAIEYINKIGLSKIASHQRELVSYCLKKLKEIKGVKIYAGRENKGVVSFTLEGVHPHDAASLLDEKKICVRTGNHCCMPLMKKLGIPGTIRVNFALYNTRADVDALIEGVKYVRSVFRK